MALTAHAAWVGETSGTSTASLQMQEEIKEQLDEITPSAARNKAIANWDPSYANEHIDWYGEFVARHGPISMSWLQPAFDDDSHHTEKLEVKGIGLYKTEHVIAPLENGSVCVWDIKNLSSWESRGAIQACSMPGILRANGHSKSITSAINGTISVDDTRDKAYIAVHNIIQEIDLHTLRLSNQQSFQWPIATISEASPNVPLTVGTNCGLHLYDPRQQVRRESAGSLAEILEISKTFAMASRKFNNSNPFSSNKGQNYAPLLESYPASILHLFQHGTTPDATQGEIFAAGRFPSILRYDRRTFPKIQNTIHSGAQLCSLTSLPYCYRSLESDLMRRNQLSVRAAQEAKSQPGDTLFACGQYQGKGSLEIYGLSSERGGAHDWISPSGKIQVSTYKNRVSISRSKLLSIATHGTRLIVSDGNGFIRWLERDGQTLVRGLNLNKFNRRGRNPFADDGPLGGSGDVAMKLLPVYKDLTSANGIHEDEILVWTGERIGLLGCTKEPRFGGPLGQKWEERVESAEEAMKRREERVYGETMRRALEIQADEVRWVNGLGLMG